MAIESHYHIVYNHETMEWRYEDTEWSASSNGSNLFDTEADDWILPDAFDPVLNKDSEVSASLFDKLGIE